MEIYENEHDQTEALKRFLREYGKIIVAVIILALAIFFGHHYLSDRTDDSVRTNSLAYEKITDGLKTGTSEALTAAKEFVSKNKNTYGAFAAIETAQQFADQKQPEKARDQLQQALVNTSDVNLQALIILRLARIQIQLKQPDAALKSLETIKSKNWMALADDLRGDALLSQGNPKAARDAWNNALQNDAPDVLRDILHMKINNLPV